MENYKIKEFYCNQLKNWKLAYENCEALKNVQKKTMCFRNLRGFIQYNPARAVSTLAKIDTVSIKSRKCFLCQENRPEEQNSLQILNNWELLVNPFPILPFHFTISNKKHIPQKLEWNVGSQLAKELSGFVVFYNDAGAGASAPDHAHFQAVPIEELPLLNLYNREINKGSLQKFSPFRIITDPNELKKTEVPVNAYFWNSNGELNFFAIPRKAHRPDLFYKEGFERRAVSPGAIDMAGIMVCPFKDDFDALTDKDIENIYTQVAFLK